MFWPRRVSDRLALIENLRRISVRISAGWLERNLADTWVDQMIAGITQSN